MHDSGAVSQAAVKERPIQFAATMVRAILDRTKCQTRRPIAPEPDTIRRIHHVLHPLRDGKIISCRFGQVGDRLWVRERWVMQDDRRIAYAADVSGSASHRWRPSYMMPRSACRIVLEITSLRVERLANITRADARAEGLPGDMLDGDPIAWFRQLWNGLCKPEHSWERNPWIWVIGFRRIEMEKS
jgi:hypothetical protein